MSNSNKYYATIKNVYSNKILLEYLTTICESEHVKILSDFSSNINELFELYTELNAKPSNDIILYSYDKNRLNYVAYLYSEFEKRYRKTGITISNFMNELRIDKLKKNINKSNREDS